MDPLNPFVFSQVENRRDILTGKKGGAKPFYSGEAIYMGPDDPSVGLTHAKHYDITAKKMASGRIRMDIDEALVGHITFDDKESFDKMFRKPSIKNRKRRK